MMDDAEWAFLSASGSLDTEPWEDKWPLRNNGLTAGIDNGAMQADHGPGLSFALNSMICVSPGEELVFFAGVPAKIDVAFHSLRFPGPVLTSGEQRDGKVQFIAIQPLTAAAVTILNPFDPAAYGTGESIAVEVTVNGETQPVVRTELAFRDPISWEPVAGQVYFLRPQAG